MKSALLILAVLALATATATSASDEVVDRPWMDKSMLDSPAQRAAALLAKMNLTEKIIMVHGTIGPYVGQTSAIPRVGIPALLLNDGPQGFRAVGHPGTSTAWPSGVTIAASWDVEAMYEWGNGMGQEFRAKGANVQLGPGVCLARVPVCGRNFEYLSGEDPYLGYTLVQPAIKGIQGNGVMATVKHFINNNEETNRGFISSNLDERTEHELYLQPFAGAVEAGVLSAMCSYNKINNVWSCENAVTLTTDLKKQLDFQGFVMSDWGATHSTVQSAMAGLDQEMPIGYYFAGALKTAITKGTVPMSVLDDKVTRILTSMFAVGVFDNPSNGSVAANVTSVAHNQLARKLAGLSTVMLQNNDKVLPLAEASSAKIVVVGDACDKTVIVAGNGSGHVAAPYVVTPFQGIKNRAGSAADVTYFTTAEQAAAVTAAKAADYAVVCTATVSGEGHDRTNLSLPWQEDALMEAIAAVQPKTIALVTNPGAVLMPWAPKVAAILMSFMPGQEVGNAVADVMFGLVNPSARLPLTMPVRDNQVEFTQAQYPGLPASNPSQANYTEKLDIGYRWYAEHKSVPQFAFGHGLSYSTFVYSNLQVTAGGNDIAGTVTLDIENSGDVDGTETAQLYLQYPIAAGEPPIVLRGFQKVPLAAGAKTTVTFTLTNRDVSMWDTTTHAWTMVKGQHTVYLAAASDDLRLSADLIVA